MDRTDRSTVDTDARLPLEWEGSLGDGSQGMGAASVALSAGSRRLDA
jgi:hypothetical protein